MKIKSAEMALAGHYPRSSVRALVVQNGKILANRCEKDGEIFYYLPGGGQEHMEDLETALRREVKEEVGCEISINELVFVFDYLGGKDPSTHANPHFHAVHHIFWCELKDPDNLGKNCLMDAHQTGHEWLPLNQLEEFNFYPKQIIPNLKDPKGAGIYLGSLA